MALNLSVEIIKNTRWFPDRSLSKYAEKHEKFLEFYPTST